MLLVYELYIEDFVKSFFVQSPHFREFNVLTYA
ncbi:hypothetical protein SAMN05443144_102225 [Fodinibius roseus]|uniref:Uncharacterized protein n=1 Tax=Fodinibius roseus TaxID=1194090 RepID=A0A1M4V8G6_9BACT|nr:hypothetical protein SAMN05443144_102225 [Fodinibius roseus]